MIRRAVHGGVAGLAGVAGMAGTITTLRRALLSSEQLAASKTHPEKIVETIAERLGADPPDDQTRRRLGDTIHFGYGAMWGAIAGLALDDTTPNPLVAGTALGAGLWLGGFGALLPGLGAHPPFWKWEGGREFLLTSAAHLAYGVATVATLRAMRGR